jgi:hypothetical protein
MALTLEAKKAKREEGRKMELHEMTAAQRIHRSLTNGRPPASEFRTTLGAFTAAATLYDEIKRQWPADYPELMPGELGVFIAYASTDLSLIGQTRLYAPDRDADTLTAQLQGRIILGLVFGIKDPERDNYVVGARPFVNTKQVDEWLVDLARTMPMAMNGEEMEWKIKTHGGAQ